MILTSASGVPKVAVTQELKSMVQEWVKFFALRLKFVFIIEARVTINFLEIKLLKNFTATARLLDYYQKNLLSPKFELMCAQTLIKFPSKRSNTI